MSKVGPYICWDEVVNAATGDEDLDNILDILDFPMESLEGEEFVGDWDASNSDDLGPIPSDVLIHPPIACTRTDTGPRTLMPTPVAPQTKIGATLKPKQLPFKFREKHKSTEVQEQGAFHTQSPVSVLESSRSSSTAKSSLTKPHINKRPRSKRSRPSGLSSWLLISSPLVVSSPASRKAHNARKNKERKKQSLPSDAPQQRPSEVDPQNPIKTVTKKCTHCEVTKTPQWRGGPMGPKTLCNACGVRYRSGRLLPEYRPAASPTFVPSVHSNSHRKVVEMRTKGKQQAVTTTEVPLNSCYTVDPICLD